VKRWATSAVVLVVLLGLGTAFALDRGRSSTAKVAATSKGNDATPTTAISTTTLPPASTTTSSAPFATTAAPRMTTTTMSPTSTTTPVTPPDDDISHNFHAAPADRSISLSFSVSTTTVRSGATFEGQLVVANHGTQPFQYDKGCDLFFGLYRQGRHVGGQPASACGDSVMATVAPGQSVTLSFGLDARSDPMQPDGRREPLAPGTYQAAAGLHRVDVLWFAPYVNLTIQP
jgi:hypothetical protein